MISGLDPDGKIPGREGRTEIVSLDLVASEIFQNFELLPRLRSLRDRPEPQGGGHRDDRRRNRPDIRVVGKG